MIASSSRTIKIAILDDQPVIWDGLTSILNSEKDLEVIVKARDPAELILNKQIKECEILILEIGLGKRNGYEAAVLFLKEFPRMNILVFTVHEEQEIFQKCIGMGVKGYVLKRDPPDTLRNAIRNILAGRMGISPAISPMLVRNEFADARDRDTLDELRETFDKLTQREKEILSLLAGGMTSKQIAEYLNVKVNTVNKHRENIRSKLDSIKLNDLIYYARSGGLI